MALSTLLFVAVTLASQDATGATAPGPIEQAVVEQRCSGIRMGATASSDPYHECLTTQLALLRSDFGTNLERLSASDRRSLDRSCSRIRANEGRERYVNCLSTRLAALHDGRAAAASIPAVPAPVRPVAAAEPRPVTHVASPAAESSRLWVPVVIAFTAVVAVACVVYLRGYRRPARRALCRACGAATNSGDLCPSCRHEAAEALRRAAARVTPSR